MSWHLLAEQGCKQVDVASEKFVNRDTIAYATSNGRYGSMDRRQDEFSLLGFRHSIFTSQPCVVHAGRIQNYEFDEVLSSLLDG